MFFSRCPEHSIPKGRETKPRRAKTEIGASLTSLPSRLVNAQIIQIESFARLHFQCLLSKASRRGEVTTPTPFSALKFPIAWYCTRYRSINNNAGNRYSHLIRIIEKTNSDPKPRLHHRHYSFSGDDISWPVFSPWRRCHWLRNCISSYT